MVAKSANKSGGKQRMIDEVVGSGRRTGPATWDKVLPAPHRRALLETIATGVHGVGLFDDGDRLVYSNEVFRTGWAIDDPTHVTFDSMIRHCHAAREGAIVNTADIDAWLVNAKRSRREGPPDRSFEVDLWDGRWMWLTERRLPDGWLLSLAQDITALKTSERTLRLARDAALKASLTDPLTELPNRRAALSFLAACVERGEEFHVAIADVDKFKQINDRFGHQAGDDVLVRFGLDLRSLQQHDYFIARLAGDEFLVVGYAGEPCLQFETNLRALIERRIASCMGCDASKVFAISIGAARFPSDGRTVKDLLAVADRAMYRAKSQGRCTFSLEA